MQINNISANTSFGGYLDKSVYKYIQKQASEYLYNKIDENKKEKGRSFLSNSDLDEIINKTADTVSKLEDKAAAMHPATRLYAQESEGGYTTFIKAKNDNIPKEYASANGIFPVTYPVEEPYARYSIAYWTAINNFKNKPEERLDDLSKIANDIKAGETDKAIVRAGMKNLLADCKIKTESRIKPISKHNQKKLRSAARQIAAIQNEIGYKDAKYDVEMKYELPKEIDKMIKRQQHFCKQK